MPPKENVPRKIMNAVNCNRSTIIFEILLCNITYKYNKNNANKNINH